MSLKNTIGTTIAFAAVAGMVVVGLVSPATSYFTATADGHTNTSVATMTVELSGPGHSAPLDLQFPNIAPGQTLTQVFHVKNTGTIPEVITLTNRNTSNSSTPGQMTGADWEYFTSGIQGYSSMVKSNVGLNANLGVLQPGQEKTFTFLQALDSQAHNNVEGLVIGTHVVVTANQQQ